MNLKIGDRVEVCGCEGTVYKITDDEVVYVDLDKQPNVDGEFILRAIASIENCKKLWLQ